MVTAKVTGMAIVTAESVVNSSKFDMVVIKVIPIPISVIDIVVSTNTLMNFVLDITIDLIEMYLN